MAATAYLGIIFADATTLAGASWLALGGILVALREFWMGLRGK